MGGANNGSTEAQNIQSKKEFQTLQRMENGSARTGKMPQLWCLQSPQQSLLRVRTQRRQRSHFGERLICTSRVYQSPPIEIGGDYICICGTEDMSLA